MTIAAPAQQVPKRRPSSQEPATPRAPSSHAPARARAQAHLDATWAWRNHVSVPFASVMSDPEIALLEHTLDLTTHM
jgi:hypothetical protein